MSNANNLGASGANAGLKASLCIVFLVVSPPAFADDSKSLFGLNLSKSDKNNSLFEGAYIGFGFNLEKNIVKKTEYSGAFPLIGLPLIYGVNNGVSYSGLSVSLNGGYNFEINPKILLGVGGELSISSSTGSVETDIYLSGSSPVLIGHALALHTLKNKYNFFISPGYVISRDKLVYSKFGYSHMDSILDFEDSAPIELDFNGYLAGLGYKQIYKDHLYGFGEINYYYYPSADGETTTLDAANYLSVETSYDSLIITFGFGYLF